MEGYGSMMLIQSSDRDHYRGTLVRRAFERLGTAKRKDGQQRRYQLVDAFMTTALTILVSRLCTVVGAVKILQ